MTQHLARLAAGGRHRTAFQLGLAMLAAEPAKDVRRFLRASSRSDLAALARPGPWSELCRAYARMQANPARSRPVNAAAVRLVYAVVVAPLPGCSPAKAVRIRRVLAVIGLDALARARHGYEGGSTMLADAEIAVRTGLSVPAVRRACRDAVDAGLLIRCRASAGQPTVWRLAWPTPGPAQAATWELLTTTASLAADRDAPTEPDALAAVLRAAGAPVFGYAVERSRSGPTDGDAMWAVLLNAAGASLPLSKPAARRARVLLATAGLDLDHLDPASLDRAAEALGADVRHAAAVEARAAAKAERMAELDRHRHGAVAVLLAGVEPPRSKADLAAWLDAVHARGIRGPHEAGLRAWLTGRGVAGDVAAGLAAAAVKPRRRRRARRS